MPVAFRLAWVAWLALPAQAVELHVRFGALERILAQQVFTEEGRRYVRGDKARKCNFAYLEKARVDGVDGRLRIRARFTGRSALNMLGQCVGMGDAFDLNIVAAPQYKDGELGLRDVVVTPADGRTGFYIRRVCAALSASLARDFRYPVAESARSALEDPKTQPDYPRELRGFRVTGIRVAHDAMVLAIDFELTVK
jgi:hypothetical protein